MDLFSNHNEREVAQFDINSDGGLISTTIGISIGIGFVSWGWLGVESVLAIDFTADTDFVQSDFSLASLDVDVVPVPEPAAML